MAAHAAERACHQGAGIGVMKIDKIISIANTNMRLEFLAMERSLRATGCDLPLWVIPYDDKTFDLPVNAQWWRNDAFFGWLDSYKTHPTMRKYLCLTQGNYHFVDVDVAFLKNPQEVMAPHEGVVTSCTEWNKPQFTYTPRSKQIFSSISSTWQKSVFSTGQFACEHTLYSIPELEDILPHEDYREACLDYLLHEQPGMNLLVLRKVFTTHNLTLPPDCMESTWAGDYPDKFESLWQDERRKPYLLHWAGSILYQNRPINDIFFSFLTQKEKMEWNEQSALRAKRDAAREVWPLGARIMNHMSQLLYPDYYLQKKPRVRVRPPIKRVDNHRTKPAGKTIDPSDLGTLIPQFFVIGAPRCGTTWIHERLKEHPEVSIPSTKETNFLLEDSWPDFRIGDPQLYASLFDSREDALRGECCPEYLYSEHALSVIRQWRPNAKIIVVLRDPADRALSEYRHLRNTGREPVDSFGRAISLNRPWRPHRYIESGCYWRWLREYVDTFGKSQVLMLLLSELDDDPQAFFNHICDFLQISRMRLSKNQKRAINSSRDILPVLKHFLQWDSPLKDYAKHLLPAFIRQDIRQSHVKPVRQEDGVAEGIRAACAESTLELERFMKADLSSWRPKSVTCA